MDAALPKPSLRRTATVPPAPMPALAPMERAVLLEVTSLSAALISDASVFGPCEESAMILLVGSRGCGSNRLGVCKFNSMKSSSVLQWYSQLS